MAAEAAIGQLVSELRSLAQGYCTAAQNLVDAAPVPLQIAEMPARASIQYDVRRPKPAIARIPRPLAVGDLSLAASLPAIPALQPIAQEALQLEGGLTESAPIVDVPLQRSPLPLSEAVFEEAAPILSAPRLQPTEAPQWEEPAPPQGMAPQAIEVPAVSESAPPSVPMPTFPPLSIDFKALFQEGGRLAGSLTAWQAHLAKLRQSFIPAEDALIGRIQRVLTGETPGLPDAWEVQRFEQARYEAQEAQEAARDALDAQWVGASEVLTGARDYARAQAAVALAKNLMLAAAKVTTARQTHEVQHLMWAISLLKGWADAALQLKAQEAGWQMEGMELAMEGADATLAVAALTMEWQEKALALLTQYNALERQRVVLQLERERRVRESVRLALENNALLATYNEQQRQVEAGAAAFVDARIALFEAHVAAMDSDHALQKQAFHTFKANVEAFQANSRAKKQAHQALSTWIQSDKNQVAAELLKVKQHDGELERVDVAAKGEALKLQLQAKQNQQVLALYNTAAEAYSRQLHGMEETAKATREALEKRYAIEAAEQELVLSDQALKDRIALSNAINAVHYDALMHSTEMKQYQMILGRKAALSKVVNQAAAVNGRIATEVLSDFTAIGTKELTELA